MRLKNLSHEVVSSLRESFKNLSLGVKGCPFHVHVYGISSSNGDEGNFAIAFSVSKNQPYGWHPDANVLARAYCKILDNLYDGHVMLCVRIEQMKQEIGCPKNNDDDHYWYRQSWRYEPFIIECDAAPLWNLLERSVDFNRIVEQVMAS